MLTEQDALKLQANVARGKGEQAPELEELESAFERWFADLAASCGYHLRYHTYDSRRSQPGYPDNHVLNVVKRDAFFAELKKTGGKVSARQAAWILALRLCGYDAYVWWPKDKPEIVERFNRKARKRERSER